MQISGNLIFTFTSGVYVCNKQHPFRVNQTKFGSEDEKVATLSFVLLDKNKNKVWERKEWKTFRELVTAARLAFINAFEVFFFNFFFLIRRALRKCGKKMPRYCDVNNDKKITLSEWLNCLQAHHGSSPEQTKTTQSKRHIMQCLSLSNKAKFFLDEVRPTSQTSKLKGPNPLESYLKSD